MAHDAISGVTTERVIPAEPAWVGRSLIGAAQPIVDHVLTLVASMADHSYGERVDMLSHALQTASWARRDGAADTLVLAALLHDIGHVLDDAGTWGLPDHADVGARFLQAWFPAEVVEPIRLHVAAKRHLVATDPGYLDRLSEASVGTLYQQGGAFTAAQSRAFVAADHAETAVALRRWDDAGKGAGVDVAPLASFRPLIEALVRSDQPA